MRKGWLLIILLISGCFLIDANWWGGPRPSSSTPDKVISLKATGYCPCGDCCGWKRNWLFQPVFRSGPNKGKRKQVGVTASGTKVKPGTVAADTRVFPFGTLLYIPGYGYGRVEDRGSAIKGNHIDLYFKTHRKALEWGVQQRQVQVWYP